MSDTSRFEEAQAKLLFWMTLFRSLFALAIGIGIILIPDKSFPLVTNFLGGFWVGGSLLSIRWGVAHDESKMLALVIGVIGFLGGISVIGRHFISAWVPGTFLVPMLGIVAILTGILHMSGLMRFQRTVNKRHTRSGKILGTFEIGLGLVLIIAGPLQDNPLLALIASGWALVGGVALLYDAIVMRRTGWRMSWIDADPTASSAHETTETQAGSSPET